MFNFKFLKKKKLLLLSFLNIFSEDETFRINQDVELVGSAFIEGNENISGSLDSNNIKVPFGNINCSGNITLSGSIESEKLSTKNSLIVGTVNLGDLNLTSSNINLNSSSGINIGNSLSGNVYLNSNKNNKINLGNFTKNIEIGGSEVLDLKVLNKKDNSLIKLTAEKINCDISDFGTLTETSLIKIDSNGIAKVGNVPGEISVDYSDAQFNTLSSKGKINLLGSFNTDENSNVLIGAAEGSLNIGNENSESLKFLGQWNFIGENIKIGSTDNESVTVGDISKFKLVKFTDFFGSGEIYITENKNSIILPKAENEFYLLKIDKNGGIFTEIPSEKNKNISLSNVETTTLDLNGDLFLNSSGQINVGNENTNNIYIKNKSTCSLETTDLNLIGTNLKLSNLSNDFDGLRHLTIDKTGLVKDLKVEDVTENLEVNNLTITTQLDAVNVYAEINSSGNEDTNIGTGSYTGNLSFGGMTSNGFLVDGDGIEFKIEDQTNNKIQLGNRSNIEEIYLKTNSSTGQINISGESLIFDSFTNKNRSKRLNRNQNYFEKINATYYSFGVINNPRITEVPDFYNVIICAFLLPEVDKVNNIVDKYNFKLAPARWDEEELIAQWSNAQQAMVNVNNPNFIGTQIKNVNSKGKQKVLLSIGGETTIDITTGVPLIFDISNTDQIEPLTTKLISIIDKYGFEGLDIDIEAEAVTKCDGEIFGEIIKNVCDHYRDQNIDFWLTCAMEYPYLSRSNPKTFYRDFINYLGKDYFTYFWPQLYNQYASLNLTGNDSSQYQVANLNDCSAVDGMENFAPQAVWAFSTNEGAAANPDLDIVPFPSGKFVIGVPASGAGAPGAYLGNPGTSGANRKVEDYACVRTEAQIIRPENVKNVWNNALAMNSNTAGFMNWELSKDVDNDYAFGKSVGIALEIPVKDSPDEDDVDVIEIERTSGRYLGINSSKKIDFYGVNWSDDDSYTNTYFAKINLKNFDGDGVVYIGDSKGNTIIAGEVFKIGDVVKTNQINIDGEILFISDYLKLKTESNGVFKIGDDSKNTDIYLGANNRTGKLILSVDDIILAIPGGRLYLFIDENGNILSRNKIKTGNDANGNFQFNVDYENDEYVNFAKFNLVSTVPTNIESVSDITLTVNNTSNNVPTGNKNIEINAENGNIKYYSNLIDLTGITGPINLYINESNYVCADINRNVRKKVENIKLEFVSLNKLKPKIFNYKDSYLTDSKEDAGFIAEDLISTDFENCILKNEENEILGINYDSLFSGVCSSYKDFITDIENLKKIMNKNKQKILNLIEV